MPEKSLSTRSAYWDNAKGILIFLVVLGHYLIAYYNSEKLNLAGVIVAVIYTFHMPAFIFISGFFSRSENSAKPKALIKLAVAYIIFNFLIMIFAFMFSGVRLSLLTPYYSYWYILVIIIWRLCIRSLNKVKGIVAISIAVALLVGFMGEFTNVLAFARIVSFFPFFLIGFRLNPEKAASFINGRKPIVYVAGAAISSLLLFGTYKIITIFNITTSDFLMESYKDAKDVLIRLAVFVLAGAVILSLGLCIPKKSIPLLSKWGRNSLAIYLFHRIVTIVFAKLLPAARYNSYYIILALAATVITMLVFGTDFVSNILNKVLDKITEILCSGKDKNDSRQRFLLQSGLAIMLIAVMLLTAADRYL